MKRMYNVINGLLNKQDTSEQDVDKCGIDRNNRHGNNNCTERFKLYCLSERGIVVENTEVKHWEDAAHKFAHKINEAQEIQLQVSISQGIEVFQGNGDILFHHEIQNIPYCALNENYPEMFVCLGERNNKIYCHLFMCDNETEASRIVNAISNIFKQAEIVMKAEMNKYKRRLSWYSKHMDLTAKERRRREMAGLYYDHNDQDYSEADTLIQ